MNTRWPSSLRSDLAGGATAAILTIPLSMGYGALAVHGLGERYIAYGVLAGLYSAILVPVVIGLLTAVTMWQGRKISTRIPAPLLGLAVGSGAYYLVAGVGYGHILGPTMGAVPAVVPTGSYLPDAAAFLGRIGQWNTLVAVVAASFSLAIIASLDALLCAKTADGVTGQRSSGNAELLRLGVGNAVAASLGALPAG